VNTRQFRPSARPRGLLSRSEARVLAFSAAGYTRDETARFLSVGAETVKSQRQSGQHKLRARNTAHAVALAFARGYLTADVLARVAAYAEAGR
jgi:DNA-binding CsgD family transcriptional regulator